MVVSPLQLLGRRRDLVEEIGRITSMFSPSNLIETREEWVAANASVESIVQKIKPVTLSEVMAEYSKKTSQYREIDAVILRVNATTKVPVRRCVMETFPSVTVGDMEVFLSVALLRRRELDLLLREQRIIAQLPIFRLSTERKPATLLNSSIKNTDKVIAQCPKLDSYQVQTEINWTCAQLRTLDTCIQRANRNIQVEVEDSLFE